MLAVNSGGEEILLRPENIQGVYQIPVESLADDLRYLPTPDGNIPTVSLAKRLASDLGFKPKHFGTERTAVVFRDGEHSVALRVDSISRPIELNSRDIFQPPALAHPTVGASFVDSLALVQNKATRKFDRIALLINPMVALGFCDNAEPLHEIIRKQNRVQAPHEQIVGDPAIRGRSKPKLRLERGNAQLLAFSPRTPLPADLDFRFCLPMSVIAEVLLDQPLLQPPSASSILSGYLIWRSRPVPAIDLAMAFGAVDSGVPTSSGRILIARIPGGGYFAILTEMNVRIFKTPKVSSIAFPSIDRFPHLGAYRDPSGLLVLPDLTAIVQPS